MDLLRLERGDYRDAWMQKEVMLCKLQTFEKYWVKGGITMKSTLVRICMRMRNLSTLVVLLYRIMFV